MQLAEWRKEKNLSCSEIAKGLGLDGDRDGTSVWNWETGRSRPDADMIDKIRILTDDAVTAADMHECRLAWLRENRPDKFAAIEAAE
jgi:transcriptional regulator with XRE-family HTH domain